MSHRPQIISLQVETKILLTTVAGRSSMDPVGKDRKHAHRNDSIYHCRRRGRRCHRESLREEAGRSIRPVHEAGRLKPEAMMIAISFTLGLSQRPAAKRAWHLRTVIIPRRTITGRLVRGRVWRRHDGRHWMYKKFIA